MTEKVVEQDIIENIVPPIDLNDNMAFDVEEISAFEE